VPDDVPDTDNADPEPPGVIRKPGRLGGIGQRGLQI